MFNKKVRLKENRISHFSIQKPFIIIQAVCFCIFLFYCQKSHAAPRLTIESIMYDFGNIYEGEEVLTNFTINNEGDTPLKILFVRSSCGCTTASYAKEILPGDTGQVSVKFNSKGYGGKKVVKSVHVKTDDPNNRLLDLIIKGQVDRIMEITPEKVILEGHAGKNIETEITITPNKKHPFKILDAIPRVGEDIICKLNKEEDTKPVKYILTVKNLRNEKGKYRDYINLKTDSDLCPVITIRVQGSIRE